MASERVATNLLRGTCIAGIGFLFIQILMYRYGRDQGVFAMVADSILHYGMPYRDAWDIKPPGVFVVYVLARALFGSGEWGIRLVEVASLTSLVFAFRKLAVRFFDQADAGLFGAALAILTYAQLEFWNTAQAESFGATVLAWALVLATHEEPLPSAQGSAGAPPQSERRRSLRQVAAWGGAGALYAFAGLLKPPLAGGALVSATFAAYRLHARGVRSLRAMATPFLAVGLGGVLMVGSFILWFVVKGAWNDLYRTLFVFVPEYTKLGSNDAAFAGLVYLAIVEWLTTFSSANLAGLVAVTTLGPRADREVEGILHVLGIVGIQLVGVALQGKFFAYHFAAALPFAGFIAGLGMLRLWRRALRYRLAGICAFALGTGMVLQPGSLQAGSTTGDRETGYWHRCRDRLAYLFSAHRPGDKAALDARLYSVGDVHYGANLQVAAFLAAHTAPGSPIFIWGFEPMIYDVAQRYPASRYIHNQPQRASWSREESRAVLMDDLSRRPPAAIVVEHHDVFPDLTGNRFDSAAELERFPELVRLLTESYQRSARIESFDIYLRQ